MSEYEKEPFVDDALDRLLAQARWPEPEPRRVARLQSYWRRLGRRAGLTSGPRFALVALAAGLLLATGAACWRWAMLPAALDPSPSGSAPLLAHTHTDDLDPAASASPQPLPANDTVASAAEVQPPWVRAPNHYEQVVLNSVPSQLSSRQARNPGPTAPAAADHAPLDSEKRAADARRRLWAETLRRADPKAMSDYLVAIEHGDRAALAAAAEVENPPLGFLFNSLEGPLVERRLAAALALGHIERAEVTWGLGQCVQRGVSRQEALVGLLARKDAGAIRLVEEARDDISLAAAVEAAQWQLNSLNNETWR
ncbi:MAG TPA: hypothetical protein VJ783_04315 [Pirellulales bacterium]|nr:hypothetical protein [Pirellulales bacterium]